MVAEAEKYKEEDSKHKQKIDARNGFENYVYSVKSSASEPGMQEKLSESDRSAIEDACKASLEWLESVGHGETETSEYEAQQKKLEGIVSPIISKLYASSDGMPDGMPQPQPSSSSSSEPIIEDLD
jgi:L1 cell adhesion molecule like protein